VGIIILLAAFLVLGFLFSWVASIVAREDVEVKTGMLVLLGTFVVSLAASLGLGLVMPSIAWMLMPLVNFGALVLMTHMIAKLGWKHSAIIAAIYAAILLAVNLGMRACAAAA